ncbi:MAG: PAS domain S-box protein [Syntrophobacteraceae bacterium]
MDYAATQKKPLRVLLVEDCESDEGLLVRLLERGGYATLHERVETFEEMTQALANNDWDMIIADFNMPAFDAPSALKVLQETKRDIPFIVVSGSIGEDAAVAMMKAGAHDYVMKDSLARLVPAVRRELSEAEVRRKNRQAEEALRESEERYRALYEDNPTMYFTIKSDGRVLSVNRCGAQELGYRVDELVGSPVIDVFYPEDREHVLTSFEKCLQNPMQVFHWEFRKVRKDGSLLWVKEAARSVPQADGSMVVLVVCEDVTENKKAEEELRRLVTAIEQCAEAIFITDVARIIRYVNPAFESISGYSKEEAVGRHIGILKSNRHGEAFYAEARNTLRRQEVWSGRVISRKKDGTTYEADATASPVKDAAGDLIGYVVIHKDITDEVRMERQIRQTQKLEALGTLAGGIAHDFNNVLTAVMGFSQMAHYKLPESSPIRNDIERVLQASARASELVRQILTFSRKTEHEPKPVRMAPIINEVLGLLRPSLPATIDIRCDIEAAAAENLIMADETQIHQILMNLATNAAHAMRKTGGTLSIRLYSLESDETLLGLSTDLRPGQYVCLSVSDTGRGMESEVLDRIFDPYFTTKGPNQGTGLGLAVVQGIVRAHGGAINVSSEPGSGAVFDVFFPRVEGYSAPEASQAAPDSIGCGSERILLVDDEELLTELVKEMLESIGYEVTALTESKKALELFQAKPGLFDLVITDMTMPNLTGKDLAEEILKIRADIPVLLCTGFSDILNDKLASEAGIREVLMKPFAMGDLVKAIGRALVKKR